MKDYCNPGSLYYYSVCAGTECERLPSVQRMCAYISTVRFSAMLHLVVL